MTHDEFLVWLQGFYVLGADIPLDAHRVFIIKNHLNLSRLVGGEFHGVSAEIENLVDQFLLTMEEKKNFEFAELKLVIGEKLKNLPLFPE